MQTVRISADHFNFILLFVPLKRFSIVTAYLLNKYGMVSVHLYGQKHQEEIQELILIVLYLCVNDTFDSRGKSLVKRQRSTYYIRIG